MAQADEGYFEECLRSLCLEMAFRVAKQQFSLAEGLLQRGTIQVVKNSMGFTVLLQ